MIEPSISSPQSRASPPAVLLIVGSVCVFAGQLLLQTYPRSPAYAWAVPTLGGLLVIVLGLIDSVFARLPATLGGRLATIRTRLDSRSSGLPLFLAAIVASMTAGLLSGDRIILRLPALALGLWFAAVALVLFASSGFGRPTGTLPRWEFIGLGLLVAAAGAARLIMLDRIPWVLAGDEASVGMTARELLDGVWTNPFRVAWYSFPSLFFFLPAASIRVFGQTIEALRLPSAIAGAMTVAALFLYARSAFGRLLAILSAGYLAFFHFHIHFSRIALNNIWDGLTLTLFSYLLWRAWSEERRALFAWAGIVAGLSFYFYTSTRVLLVIVPIWIGVAWLRERARVRRIGTNWLILVASALVVVLPLAIYFAIHPEEFIAPMQRVSLLGPWLTKEMAATGQPGWRLLLDRLGDSALAFTGRNLQYWYRIDHPMLLPLPATLFLIGIIISLWRAFDLRYTWLLLWLASGVAVGGLSESAPAAQRYVFLAPAVALLVALPLAEVAARVAPTTRPRHAILILGLGAILLAAVAHDLWFYFEDYTPSHAFSDSNTEVAQNLGLFLSDSGLAREGTQVYFSGQPRMGWDSIPTLPYLAPEVTFIEVAEPLAAPPTWNVGRPAAFVFLPQNLEDLVWIQQAYPGGETIVRPSVTGGQLYTVYLLR